MAYYPDAELGFFVENLKQLVIDDYLLMRGLRDHVEELAIELKRLGVFIRYFRENYSNNEILEKLASEIRDVFFRAEDAVETYISRAAEQKLRGGINRAVHLVDHVSDIRAWVKGIEKVREDVRMIMEHSRYLESTASVQIVDISSRRRLKEEKIPVIEEDNVVGFDDAAEEVIELLTGESDNESDQLKVISIIGMLGLGKTTLAKMVFNDPKIEYLFYFRAFVNVSQEYTRKEVFLKILGQFTQITDKMNYVTDEELVQELRNVLKTRRYLIVMDDVWTKEAWSDLKSAFPNNNKGSRVLITSRNKLVAVYANPAIDPYFLRFLYPDESRELLRRKVFGENCFPSELESYELRILQKCDGLPLAIAVVAGILVNHRDRTDWWKRVAEYLTGYVARNQEQSYALIKLSYNHMPHHLKPCFLYLGVFGKDFEIPVWKLVRLWIAEGFIPRDGSISLEDTAKEYLEELIVRNLVMVGHRRLTGEIKTCRFDKTLHDFCKKEAMKENIFQEIKRFDQASSLSAYPSGNFRRLCVNASVYEYVTSSRSGEYVRSFMSFAKEETTLPPEHVSFIPKAFKLLRVLDVRSIIFTRFPTDLLYLVLLRYIALSCHFKILPEKMANLWNLQTLIVETSSHTLEIEADICKLPQLRHLHTNASTSLVKCKKELSFNGNLQTLSIISPESCRAEVFDRTPRLKKLGICGKLANVIEPNGESDLFASLVKLEDLENLKLLNNDGTSKLHTLPRENMFPRKLTRLTLLNTKLDWSQMSIVGKLENLEVLKLKDNAFRGVLWQTEDDGFHNLKILQIGLTDLVIWRASASSFPVLRSLFLGYCRNLEALPDGITNNATLQEIDLYYTNSSVVSSARRVVSYRLEVQAKDKNERGAAFKLSVYPPDL